MGSTCLRNLEDCIPVVLGAAKLGASPWACVTCDISGVGEVLGRNAEFKGNFMGRQVRFCIPLGFKKPFILLHHSSYLFYPLHSILLILWFEFTILSHQITIFPAISLPLGLDLTQSVIYAAARMIFLIFVTWLSCLKLAVSWTAWLLTVLGIEVWGLYRGTWYLSPPCCLLLPLPHRRCQLAADWVCFCLCTCFPYNLDVLLSFPLASAFIWLPLTYLQD